MTERRRPPAPPSSLDLLIARLRERQPRALGRAISIVERGGADQAELVRRLYADDRPGARRRHHRSAGRRQVDARRPPRRSACARRGATVGILCVDPTSPFTGGALLGDRIRMQGLATDPGVFIRSMATRGAMGGLARATRDAVDLLDAAGFDWILVETVGVGQDEVDVVASVDTVLVVAVPGLGDDIQAIKAGIMEIADVFVLNKADREGADRTFKDLAMLLSLAEGLEWVPPIVRTVAARSEGIEATARRDRAPPRLAGGGGAARAAAARPAPPAGRDDPQGTGARRGARRSGARTGGRARLRRPGRSLPRRRDLSFGEVIAQPNRGRP